MTARSILVQLTSFVLCVPNEAENFPHETLVRIRQEIEAFKCSCGHDILENHPEFPSESDILCVPTSYPPVQISSAEVDQIRRRRYARTRAANFLKSAPDEKRVNQQVDPNRTSYATIITDMVARSQALVSDSNTESSVEPITYSLKSAVSDDPKDWDAVRGYFDEWVAEVGADISSNFGPSCGISLLPALTITQELLPFLTANDVLSLMSTCRCV